MRFGSIIQLESAEVRGEERGGVSSSSGLTLNFSISTRTHRDWSMDLRLGKIGRLLPHSLRFPVQLLSAREECFSKFEGFVVHAIKTHGGRQLQAYALVFFSYSRSIGYFV